MPTASTEASRRGLMVAVVVLVLILALVDLSRPDSVLRAVWSDVMGPRSPLRGFLDTMRERGPGHIFQR